MDRTQFCEIIKQIKRSSHISDAELAYKTQSSEAQVRKILSGEKNFFMESAWRVMEVLKLTLIVDKAGKRYEIMNQPELNNWAEMSRIFSRMSVVKFAEQCGMSRMALTDNLKGKSKMRIDTFLRWADVTGYQVEISK